MGIWHPGRCPGLRTCWAFSPRRAADRAFLHNLHQPLIFLFCPLPFRDRISLPPPHPPKSNPYAFWRIWDVPRPHLLPATTASGPSDDRLCSQMRSCLGRRSPPSRESGFSRRLLGTVAPIDTIYKQEAGAQHRVERLLLLIVWKICSFGTELPRPNGNPIISCGLQPNGGR